MSLIPSSLPATEVEPEIDRSSPWAVWIDACERNELFEVNARQPDGSMLTVIRGVVYSDALRIAARVRDAIVHDEPWAVRLIDSSAGKLRE